MSWNPGILHAIAMHQLRCSDCHWNSLWNSKFFRTSKQREKSAGCGKWEPAQLNLLHLQNYSIKPTPLIDQCQVSHSTINCNYSVEHLAVLSAFLVSWPADIRDRTRLLVLIKKLHILQGCRGKLRKIYSIRTENKGRQVKGGLLFKIGQAILAQIFQKYAT